MSDLGPYSQTLEEVFPAVDPGVKPLGSNILVQLRTPPTKSKGGIILSGYTKDAQVDNEQTALVIAVGPLAYRDRTSLKEWPEGQWCQVGQYVRVPKYAGDRFSRDMEGKEEKANFAIFKDTDIIAAITCDPRDVKAHVF